MRMSIIDPPAAIHPAMGGMAPTIAPGNTEKALCFSGQSHLNI